jgi:hypothetical protein
MRKLGRTKEAQGRLSVVSSTMEIIENFDYYDVLLMYKTGDETDLIAKTKDQSTISNATLGFSLGTFYLLNGKKEKAKDMFEKVVAGNQWSSFGFIGAEAELARMK